MACCPYRLVRMERPWGVRCGHSVDRTLRQCVQSTPAWLGGLQSRVRPSLDPRPGSEESVPSTKARTRGDGHRPSTIPRSYRWPGRCPQRSSSLLLHGPEQGCSMWAARADPTAGHAVLIPRVRDRRLSLDSGSWISCTWVRRTDGGRWFDEMLQRRNG